MANHNGTIFPEHLSLLRPASCYFTRMRGIDTRGTCSSDDSSPMLLLEIHPNEGSLLMMNWLVLEVGIVCYPTLDSGKNQEPVW